MPDFLKLEGPRKMSDEDKAKEQLTQESRELRGPLGKVERQPPTTNGIHVEPEAGEPWLPIETKLVTYSVIGGIAALIVLAIVVHIFILGAH